MASPHAYSWELPGKHAHHWKVLTSKAGEISNCTEKNVKYGEWAMIKQSDPNGRLYGFLKPCHMQWRRRVKFSGSSDVITPVHGNSPPGRLSDSHLHSHSWSSQPASIRLMLPKHSFHHDIAWSNSYNLDSIHLWNIYDLNRALGYQQKHI